MQKKLSKSGIITSLIIMMLLVACSVVLFAGCGGTNPVGTWKVDRIVVDNVTIKASDTDKKGQESVFNNVIILNNDKTGKVTMGENAEVAATWKQENTAITINYGNNDYNYILSGTELTKTDGTTKIFYKKSA